MQHNGTPAPHASAGIPALLRNLNRWTTWDWHTTAGGRLTKRPHGSTLDPRTMRPYADVAGAPLIGFVTTGGIQTPDGKWAVALDLDACRDPATGLLTGWAESVWNNYGRTWTETTPSGTGLRIWILTQEKPEPIPTIPIPAAAPPGVDKKPEIQVFGCGPAGYVAVTGEILPGSSADIITVRSLDWLRKTFRVDAQAHGDHELPTGTGDAPDTAEILKALLVVPDGGDMIDGEWQKLEMPSASELWYRLVRATLRAAKFHGDAAVEFLMERTAYGTGQVDSRDPARYARHDWVARDVARVAGKAGETGDLPFTVVAPDEFEPPPPPPDTSGPWLLSAGDFDLSIQRQRFAVYGVLPARGVAQFFGDPGAGKTPYAISLALHIATGQPSWFGHDIDVEGPVVYMVGEDAAGVRDRLKAQIAMLPGGNTLQTIKTLHVSTRPAQLVEPGNAAAWVEKIREKYPDGIRLLVVDTQNRNFGPGNENDTSDMSRYVDSIDAIGRALECLVLLVHHVGLADKQRARGSSVLLGAIDAAFRVDKADMDVTAHPTKSKNWADPAPLRGTLVPHTLGQDEKGRPVTAITLDSPAPLPFDQVELEEDLRGLVEAIRKTEGRPVSQAELAEAAELSRKELRIRLDRLKLADLVEISAGSGRGGSTYALADNPCLCWPLEGGPGTAKGPILTALLS